MRFTSKLMLIAGAVLSLASFAACGSTGGNSGGSGGGSGCTPGVQQACACLGGTMGIQVCNDEGRGFGTCQCEMTSSSSSSSGTASSSSSSGSTGTCGDGIKQASDQCGNPASEFYCKADCEIDGGTGGSGGAGGSCAGHVYYAGMYKPVAPSSVWGGLPGAGGLTGLDAGNNQCKALNIGADHVCDYEEVLKAQAQGELAAIPQGTTAWVHRTTVAMVNGQPSQPGPGGRCNDWTYATNHISDGEYVAFEQAGVPTFYLDNDTVYDGNAPGVHTLTGLQCGGEIRALLCCYQACE